VIAHRWLWYDPLRVLLIMMEEVLQSELDMEPGEFVLWVLGPVLVVASFIGGFYFGRRSLRRTHVRVDGDLIDAGHDLLEPFEVLMVDQTIADQAEAGVPTSLYYRRCPQIVEATQEETVQRRKALLSFFGDSVRGYQITVGGIVLLAARYGLEPLCEELKASFTDVERAHPIDAMMAGVKRQ